MTANVALDIRPFDTADQPAVLALLERSLGAGPAGERSADFFEWKHFANPFGRSPAFVATADGEVVGFRTFMRWQWRVGDQLVRAVRAVDTATDPRFQGAGVFTSLTRAAIREITPTTDLIFNTPNDKSLPGYLKMGWSPVGRVPVWIRPVRPLRFVRGLRVAGKGGAPLASDQLAPAHEVLTDTAALDELLASSPYPADRLRTARSATYLQWRYGDAPGLGYRAVALSRPGAGLRGIAVGRMRRRGNLVEFALAELLTAPGDTVAARSLLKAVTQSGCDHVTAVVESDPTVRPAFARRAFVRAPRSQGVVLVAKPLRALTPDPTALRSWAVSLGDLELF